MSYMSYPEKFGFIVKSKDMIGKTIEDISVERMEWGCTWDNCILIRFSDGSRGFLLGKDSNSIVVNPQAEVFEKSRFFTPEEVGQVVADKKARDLQRETELRRDKERRIAQLQKELGQP